VEAPSITRQARLVGKHPIAISALSLSEVLITLGIIGILAMISISFFSGNIQDARQGVAVDSAALLNHAISHFNQIAGPIDVGAAEGSADELYVLELLQTRDASLPGSPYVPSEFLVEASSDPAQIRLTWTGDFFKVVPVGTAGAGIVVAR